MLLDEDPAALISSCAANFNIAPDRSSISRIHSSLSALSQFRNQQLAQDQEKLGRLAREQQTLQSQHALTVAAHNPTSHAAEILRLDTEKFKIAKAASDAEIEGERLAGELDRLKAVLDELEVMGVDGEGPGGASSRPPNEDEVLLKLKLYRSLGIDVEADPATGAYNKAVIRNRDKGDVHVVNIDGKFSRQFYANYFWQTL